MSSNSTFGSRLALTSGGGQQNLLPSGVAAGPMRVLLRAEDPGIYIGGYNVDSSLPGTGFELTPGVDYDFVVLDAGALYAATTSGSAVHIFIFFLPKV